MNQMAIDQMNFAEDKKFEFFIEMLNDREGLYSKFVRESY